MTPRDEILAAGNTNISLWSQNSAAHPHLYTEYVQRGAPAGVNTRPNAPRPPATCGSTTSPRPRRRACPTRRPATTTTPRPSTLPEPSTPPTVDAPAAAPG